MSGKPTDKDLIKKLQDLEKENARLKDDNQVLKSSAARYQSFLQSTDDAVLICDRNGNAISWNPAYEHLTKSIFHIPLVSGLELYQALPKKDWENTLNLQNSFEIEGNPIDTLMPVKKA